MSMEFRSFNSELAIASLLFQRCFNNIQIERSDKQRRKSLYRVPCVNAQRSRILKGFQNKDRLAGLQLPMIAFSRTGYSRMPDRLNNLHNEVKYEITSKNRNQQLMAPVPVDINFDLTIFAKYQSDIDKIASNFMVFFNNDIYVSCEHPKFQFIKMHNQIVMSDNVSEEHPDEFDGSQDDVVTSTFQFTFKTYLFGGTTQYQKKKGDGGREIYDGIPIVRHLSIGFYNVPTQEDIEQYIISVDSDLIVKHEHSRASSYISSESYLSVYGFHTDDEGNVIYSQTGLSGINDYYSTSVDNYCSHDPFVDRLYWKIDNASALDYPYNVIFENERGLPY